jgi:DNA-binding NtrC family response regulator
MQTIVVIDDNDQLRRVVKRAVTTAGFAVRDWSNPKVALDDLATFDDEIALVIIDGAMPQMTGPAAAAKIRALHPTVPVLLMSGHEAPMFPEFFEVPGHHYIAKPFVVSDLIARVAQITGSVRA